MQREDSRAETLYDSRPLNYRHLHAWFGDVSLSKTILLGTLEGGRRRGRQRKCWMDIIKEWTPLPMSELLTAASCRKHWKRVLNRPSCPPPTTLWVMGLNGTAFTRAVSLRLSPIRRCGTESGRACLPHGPYTSPEFSVQIFFSLKTTSRIRLTTALSFWWSVRNQQYQVKVPPFPTQSQ